MPPLNSPELGTLPFFGGWLVLDLVISEGGQFRTLFFSGFWHIGKFGGGKKDQTPCTSYSILTLLALNQHSIKIKVLKNPSFASVPLFYLKFLKTCKGQEILNPKQPQTFIFIE